MHRNRTQVKSKPIAKKPKALAIKERMLEKLAGAKRLQSNPVI